MKKDIILILLILLHLFFFVSIFAISPSNNIINNKLPNDDRAVTTTTTTTITPTTTNDDNNINTQIPVKQQQQQQTNNNQQHSNIINIDNKNNNIVIENEKQQPQIKQKEKTNNNNNEINQLNYTYVTFADNAEYLKGIVALRMSMIDTGCKYGLIVFVTKQVSLQDREPLVLLNCDVREIEMVDIPKEVTVQIDRWRPAFTKFRAWQLTEFQGVIWLDSDMLLLRSLDHLFEKVNVANPKLMYAAIDADANSCKYKPDRLKLINSGIMVLSPSHDVYQSLIDGMVVVSKLSNQLTVNDQDVINTTLPDWGSLNYPEYGVQITHCECDDPRLWNFGSTYFLHFTAGLKELPKPWLLLKLSTTEVKELFSKMPRCIEQIYLNWMNTYKSALDLIDNNLNLNKT